MEYHSLQICLLVLESSDSFSPAPAISVAVMLGGETVVESVYWLPVLRRERIVTRDLGSDGAKDV